jgi:hypothetical protein
MTPNTTERDALLNAALRLLNVARMEAHVRDALTSCMKKLAAITPSPEATPQPDVRALVEALGRIDAYVADLPWKDDCTEPGLYDIRDRTGASYHAIRAERHPSSGNLQCMGMNVSTMRNCGLGYQWRRIPDAALKPFTDAQEVGR